MLIFQKMLTVFILMAIGFLFGRKGWINDDNSGLLSKIVINVANPGMILAAGLDSDTTLSNQLVWNTFLMAVLFYIALVATAPFVMRLMRIPADVRGTYQYMYVFGNIGFMGMPLIVAVYGQESALLVAMFNFVFNILMYTYGMAIIRREAAYNAAQNRERSIAAAAEAKEEEAGAAGTEEEHSAETKEAGAVTSDQVGHANADMSTAQKLRKSFLNVGTISSVLALICFAARIHVPDFLYDSLEMMSNLACPLSMFVIGASLAVIAPKKLVSDMRLNLFILVRLIIIPILGVAFVKLVINPEELLMRVFYVMISVPFASTSVMMAQEYGGRKDVASQGVAFSTLVSVATIPLVGMIFGL